MTQSQDESIRTALRENGRRLRDFIRSRVAEPEDADDIFQDVVLELTSAYRLMQPIEKMAAWLFRVARNKITDRYRRKKSVRLEEYFRFPDPSGEDTLLVDELLRSDTAGPDAEFDRSLLLQAIESALDELPVEQREVFIAHELEGKSFQQLSDESGLSINTLLARKRYAILKLRERLQEYYDELNTP
ncbi:MAG: RNA polymerase sigma factor [Candidatus Pollutiaquabacter aromativorans]